MQELWLIGIGTGNPEHLTFAGARALQEAELILIPRKGEEKSDLADLRREICDRILDSGARRIVEFDLPVRDPDQPYFEAVDLWHDAIAEAWRQAAGDVSRVALLVWGDPSLYDSSLRIASRLDPAPAIRIEPGITALQALTAAHAIPVNEIGQPFIVTTGRQLREKGWPDGVDTVVVMLDGGCAFQNLPFDNLTIWWGAYLGMPHQLLVNGPVEEVTEQILQTRRDGRSKHGWIMDIYLLRRL